MKVSVIIPCYNVGKYIETCLESVFSQTYRNIEIILVDDGSKDDLKKQVEILRIRSPFKLLFIEQENAGASHARNTGISHAEGDYFQFLDADDWLEPQKIETQINLINKADFPDLIVGSYQRQNEAGDILKKVIYSPENIESIWLMLMKTNLGITSANLFKSDFFKQKKGKWNPELKSSQEYDLMFHLIKNSENLAFSDQIHTIIRQRGAGSISQTNLKENSIRYIELRIKIIEYIKAKQIPLNYQKCYQILFDAIRTLYPMDPAKAKEFFKNHIPKDFKPSVSPATTKSYILTYQLLGFNTTEKLKLKLKNRTN